MSQPILLVFDAPGATAAQYDAIIRDLEAAGESAPRGRTFHAAAATADGWQVIDVWESQADFDRFAKTLGPLIQTHMADSRVAPKFYPVHRRIAGVAATGVKPYILAVKMTGPVAEYDTTVARLQAEAGGVPFPGRSYTSADSRPMAVTSWVCSNSQTTTSGSRTKCCGESSPSA